MGGLCSGGNSQNVTVPSHVPFSPRIENSTSGVSASVSGGEGAGFASGNSGEASPSSMRSNDSEDSGRTNGMRKDSERKTFRYDDCCGTDLTSQSDASQGAIGPLNAHLLINLHGEEC